MTDAPTYADLRAWVEGQRQHGIAAERTPWGVAFAMCDGVDRVAMLLRPEDAVYVARMLLANAGIDVRGVVETHDLKASARKRIEGKRC
jgi:hypothetical protein